MPAVGAPGIQDSFGTSYEATAAWLLVVPGVFALLVEPVLFLLADRHPRRWFVLGGLAMMALAAFASAVAPGPVWLAAVTAVSWVAGGCGVGLAQATLCDANPDRREQVMTRWALLGVAGDLAAPGLFALLAAAALGWRTGFVVVGGLTAVVALLLARPRFPAPAREPHQDELGLLAALGVALRNRRLLLWLGAEALCNLLDEIFVVFAALRLRDDLGADAGERSVALAVLVAAEAVGLLIADRLLKRIEPVRLLAACALACSICYTGWLLAPDLASAIVALAALGLTVSPLYPIAAAQSYGALPGRSGAAAAAGHLFTPLVLVLPWLLGRVADRWGTTAALLLLLAQPVGLFLISIWSLRGVSCRR